VKGGLVVGTTQDQLHDAFGAYVRSQRQLAQLTLRQVAELARISNPYLSQIEHGLVLPSIAVLGALADALSVSAETMLLRAAGIVRPSSAERLVQTEDSIRHDSRLDNSQKQALLTVLASFVGSAPAPVLRALPSKTTASGGPGAPVPAGSEPVTAEHAPVTFGSGAFGSGVDEPVSDVSVSEEPGSEEFLSEVSVSDESVPGGSVPVVARKGSLRSTSARPAAAGRVAGSQLKGV